MIANTASIYGGVVYVRPPYVRSTGTVTGAISNGAPLRSWPRVVVWYDDPYPTRLEREMRALIREFEEKGLEYLETMLAREARLRLEERLSRSAGLRALRRTLRAHRRSSAEPQRSTAVAIRRAAMNNR